MSNNAANDNGEEQRGQKRSAEEMASSMSKDLICPITQELMVDPVLAADGISYERKEITQWLASNNTSRIQEKIR